MKIRVDVLPAIFIALSAFLIYIMFISDVDAGNYHHNTPDVTYVTETYITEEYITEEYVTEQYITENYITENYRTDVSNDMNDGVALNLSAAALQFDWSTDAWQYSGGLGNYENRTAGSFGLAKRFGGILLNGSYNRAMESGKAGYNVGITGRFK